MSPTPPCWGSAGWFPPGVREQLAPDWHDEFIQDAVLPALRAAGTTEQQLTTMLVDNPRRYFTAA